MISVWFNFILELIKLTLLSAVACSILFVILYAYERIKNLVVFVLECIFE